jgi:transformer-2 protein
MAPSNAPISIPTGDVTMANGAADNQAWDGGRSPGRGSGDLPRRSSRSRSPGRGNGDDRGCVSTLSIH